MAVREVSDSGILVVMKKSEQNAILKKITFDWSQRNFEKAFAEIEKLVREGTPDFRASALLLGGMIKEELGTLEEARFNWLSGLESSTTGTFTTYSLEHNIGSSFEKQGLLDEAVSWFRKSLVTCAAGNDFSGEQALSDFCRLTSGDLSDDDKRIVAIVLDKSWRVLGLSGKPDSEDLKASVRILGLHFAGMVDRANDDD